MHQMLIELTNKLLSISATPSQARTEAWLLLEKATGKSKASLLTSKMALSDQEAQVLNFLLDERINKKKPLAYILETIPFVNLTLHIRAPILIPRPETEEMVAWIIEKFAPYEHTSLTVLDLCTGSGCIALALASAFPVWQFVGIDINPEAIALAKENQIATGLKNVTFKQGSIFTSQDWAAPCDLIVSNPPYIDQASINLVDQDVLNWEDKQALFADRHGWAFYEEIAKLGKKIISTKHLDVPNLIWEFGVDQKFMYDFMIKTGYKSVKIHKDLAGIERWGEGQV